MLWGRENLYFLPCVCTVYIMLQVSFTYAEGCVTNADEFQMEKLICKVNI